MFAYQFQLRQRCKDVKLFNTESSTPRCDCTSPFVTTTFHDVTALSVGVRHALCYVGDLGLSPLIIFDFSHEAP